MECDGQCSDIKIDSNNNIYVTGHFGSSSLSIYNFNLILIKLN